MLTREESCMYCLHWGKELFQCLCFLKGFTGLSAHYCRIVALNLCCEIQTKLLIHCKINSGMHFFFCPKITLQKWSSVCQVHKAAGGNFISFQWNSFFKFLPLRCGNINLILLFVAASPLTIYKELCWKSKCISTQLLSGNVQRIVFYSIVLFDREYRLSS